jgi:O-methyltransferase involved in polyketide biosynthesis
MAKVYGIPPRAHWQREEFQRELKATKHMMAKLGWPEKVFQSPAEVAAWLREAGLRPSRPVTAELVKFWCRTRRFPSTYLRSQKVKFLTTNVHVLAWLFSTAREPIPKTTVAPKSPMRCPL